LQLLRLGEEDHFLVLGLHHTCADGWSRPLFWRDLAAYYNAHVTGRPAELPELPLQFGDFAAWQRRLIESPEFQPHLDYWVERLRGLQPLELPTDRPRPTAPSFERHSVEAVIEREVLDGLRALAERASATRAATRSTRSPSSSSTPRRRMRSGPRRSKACAWRASTST